MANTHLMDDVDDLEVQVLDINTDMHIGTTNGYDERGRQYDIILIKINFQ